jgi:phage tail sheath gpL-like
MAISFEKIPSNIRVPLFYVEISGRQASYFAQNQISLMFGPMLPTGIAEPLTPALVPGYDDAVGLFGAGSILADMVNVYRKNDSFGELWCIPHSDATANTSAVLTGAAPAADLLATLQALTDAAFAITINGTVQTAGPVNLTAAVSLNDAARLLGMNLAGVNLVFNGTAFVVTTFASGAAATLTNATAPPAGTDVSADLMLTAATSASLVQGGTAPAQAASKELAVFGTARSAGSIFGYVAGDRIVTNIPTGFNAAQIAQAVSDAVNAEPFCLLSAAPNPTTPSNIIFTCKQAGAIGNEIDVSANLRGVAGGEFFPPGVSITTVTSMGGGVGQPPLADIINAMADDEYDFIGSPYQDSASLDALDDLMNDLTGRWAWDRQIYGGVFTAKQGTAQELTDFGRGNSAAGTYGRNGPHVHILGYAPNPTPSWRRAAALTAQAATGLRIDPARPLQTLPLIDVLPPPRGKGFRISEKNTLLYSGISVEMADLSGQVRIQRCISTYQHNAWGQYDQSWLDVQTSFTLMYVVRFLRQRLLQKFPRHKLADDGTPFGPGQAVATPSIIRGELVAAYGELIELGLVENMDLFKEHLIVERNADDPNRVDILFPPDLINQLRILALLVEFRLQYPTAVLGMAA